jgi:hypothetical protein
MVVVAVTVAVAVVGRRFARVTPDVGWGGAVVVLVMVVGAVTVAVVVVGSGVVE